MYKLTAGIVLIFACGLLGILHGHTYKQRVRELQDLKDILQMLQMEIHYRKEPLPFIFQRLSETKNSIATMLLRQCNDNITSDQTLQQSWTDAVKQITMKSCLCESDKKILYDLGFQLGKSNVSGQSDLLLMTKQKLDFQLKEAEEAQNTKGKMYSGLGFSAGIVFTILLI